MHQEPLSTHNYHMHRIQNDGDIQNKFPKHIHHSWPYKNVRLTIRYPTIKGSIILQNFLGKIMKQMSKSFYIMMDGCHSLTTNSIPRTKKRESYHPGYQCHLHVHNLIITACSILEVF